MKNKKVILFLFLTILWMGIVFYFSAETADVSKQTSTAFMEKIADFFGITITNKQIFQSKLRSFAHFGLYLCGGVVSFSLFIISTPKRKYIYCALLGMTYALLDEVHQIFVPGRAFEIKDITIDLMGFFIGVVFAILINKLIKEIMYKT